MKTFKYVFSILFLAISFSSCMPESGDSYNDGPSGLKVASEFSDGMIFQSGVEIPVYGTAFKTTEIKVIFNGVDLITKSNAEGNWKVHIPSQKIGGPYELRVIANDTTVVLESVTVADDVEKRAIISVIENQTKAHLAKDYKKEASTFIQDKSTTVLISRKSWYGYLVGWDKLSESIKINNNNDPKPSTDYFENTGYKVNVYEKSAWVIYNENLYKANGKLIKVVINVRFLEKENGNWKIVFLSDVDTSSYTK